MHTDLTPKQKILLQKLREHRRKYGVYPSLGELKVALNVKFPTSVVGMLEKLEEKGYIKRASGIERGITLVEHPSQTVSIRIVGSVACGKPLLAQENTEGYIPVDKSLLRGEAEDYFFLRAIGNSMNLAEVNGKTIENGDFVLIKSQNTADQNEKVVALIDDEVTIKVLKKEPGYVALVPKSSDTDYKPIILHEDFTIQGIVKAVFKQEMLTA